MSEVQKEEATIGSTESTKSKVTAEKGAGKAAAPNGTGKAAAPKGAVLMQGGIYRIDHGKGDK